MVANSRRRRQGRFLKWLRFAGARSRPSPYAIRWPTRRWCSALPNGCKAGATASCARRSSASCFAISAPCSMRNCGSAKSPSDACDFAFRREKSPASIPSSSRSSFHFIFCGLGRERRASPAAATAGYSRARAALQPPPVFRDSIGPARRCNEGSRRPQKPGSMCKRSEPRI